MPNWFPFPTARSRIVAEAVDASLREKVRLRQLEARYHTPAGCSNELWILP